MNKSHKQLVEDHKCEIHLSQFAPLLFKACYAYWWDAETRCKFTLLSEVAESLQGAFQHILRSRGLAKAGRVVVLSEEVRDLLCPADSSAGRRWLKLLPAGVPRWVRCYDNGDETADRYTVVFTGSRAAMRMAGCAPQYPYLAMSASPFHPQGVGMHGHTDYQPADVNKHGWAPAIGQKNHLGTRIEFEDLPEDCRKAVFADYIAIWKL